MSGEREWTTAGEVPIGSWLWIEDDRGHKTPRRLARRILGECDGSDRKMTLWFDDSYTGIHGDTGQTVYLATDAEIAEARVARMRGRTT